MARRIRSHMTYANVVATLALFVALAGGTAFAISKISGTQIKKNSLPVNRRVKGAVVPAAKKAKVAARIPQLVVPRRSGSAHHKADLGDCGAANGGSLIRLSVGDSCTVSHPPFTLKFTCTDEGGGVFDANASATSSVDGWRRLGGGPTSPNAAGEFVTVADQANSGELISSAGGETLITPSGDTLSLGNLSVGVHLDGDCMAVVYGVG